MQHDKIKTVTLLAFDGTIEMSIAVQRDIFFAGSLELKRTQPDQVGGPLVQLASQDGEAVRSFNGSVLQADISIDAVEHADLILVSSVWGEIQPFLDKHQKSISWLKKQHQQGALIGCLGTSSFLLAETGLLEGKSATIYWRMIDEFKQRYPQVLLQEESTITSADGIFCAAGINAGLELGVYLMERVWGGGVARKVVQNYLMDVSREASEFLLEFDRQKNHDDSEILTAQQWLEDNYSANFLLQEVAANVGLSLRSFMRRFKNATGETPINYLQRVRVQVAMQLLSMGSLSVDEISYRVGYEDVSFFCRLFKRYTQLTPGEFKLQRP